MRDEQREASRQIAAGLGRKEIRSEFRNLENESLELRVQLDVVRDEMIGLNDLRAVAEVDGQIDCHRIDAGDARQRYYAQASTPARPDDRPVHFVEHHWMTVDDDGDCRTVHFRFAKDEALQAAVDA